MAIRCKWIQDKKSARRLERNHAPDSVSALPSHSVVPPGLPTRLLFAETAPLHTSTDWQLKPSFKYDTLCLLNVLSGDPYYLHYYQAEYDHFHPLFTPEEQAAFAQLKHVIKDEGHGIISAKLALYYSAVDDETLPEMIRTAHDSAAMEAALQKTSYWSADGWQNYEAARPALEAALRALDRVGFPAYWAANAKPKIEKRIAELSPELPKYNIIPVIESYLGFPLPSQTITVYLLAYSEPHGIRITGLRFLTHVSYPFSIVLHNAIHEPMHPPYHADDPKVREAIESAGARPARDRQGSAPRLIFRIQHDSRLYRRRLRASVRGAGQREVRRRPQCLQILAGAGWRHACPRGGYVYGLQAGVL